MEIAPYLQALIQAPQSMHLLLLIFTIFSLVNTPTGQTSTHPAQAPPQEQLVHLPSFQQHLL